MTLNRTIVWSFIYSSNADAFRRAMQIGGAVLSQMIYASRVCAPASSETINEILQISRKNNQRVGIGGVLLYDERYFFQGVEGERSDVNSLLNRLVKDFRHTDFHLLSFKSLSHRHFSRWCMATASAVMARAPFLFKHEDSTEFDPYTLSDHHAVAVLGHIAGLTREQCPTLGEELHLEQR
ncbi:BLUF domain-containing protein [Rhodoferax aquaticus]|uniref:BLUF domain-containing protein n=1 Tax=Rhodoferax aquaticus TaxID=2527691 RepID=A0A515EQ13_9BURK|nr:BLUF domain-containing protein [Rhodoferax aquaticus]QDL54763.1 BLUF domain-containing protein [Rhodoferax aquaticus]